jgi:hypothetical protein
MSLDTGNMTYRARERIRTNKLIQPVWDRINKELKLFDVERAIDGESKAKKLADTIIEKNNPIKKPEIDEEENEESETEEKSETEENVESELANTEETGDSGFFVKPKKSEETKITEKPKEKIVKAKEVKKLEPKESKSESTKPGKESEPMDVENNESLAKKPEKSIGSKLEQIADGNRFSLGKFSKLVEKADKTLGKKDKSDQEEFKEYSSDESEDEAEDKPDISHAHEVN